MDGGVEQSRQEGEVVDEEAEFGLVALPVRRAVEGEGEEDHIDAGEQRRFREEGAGQEGEHQRDLEDGGEPGEKQRERKAGRGDVAGRIRHSGELEDRRHGEDAGEDQPGDQDCCGSAHWSLHQVFLQ